MRIFFLLSLVLSCFLTKAQDSNLTKKIIFCGIAISVPPDCQFKESNHYINNKLAGGGTIKKGNQFVQWSNDDALPDQVRDEAFQQVLDQTLSHFEKKNGGYKKKPMEFSSLGQDLRGWLIKVKFDNENRYFLLASGLVNSEYIRIYCGLTKKPKNNEAIPDFISQIIQMK